MINSTLRLVVILSLHLVLLFFTRFTLWPEMVVYPYLLNNGFYLYKDIINPYLPSFIFLLSLFSKIFGFSPLPYQILTWAIIITTDIIIYFIVKRISNKELNALAATVFFALFSTPLGINGLWFDLLQTPLIILSVYFASIYLKTKQRENLFKSLIFLTLAFLIKQQAIIFAFSLSLFLFAKIGTKLIKDLQKLKILILLIVSLAILHLIIFYLQKNLADFLIWTIYFPFFKASTMQGYVQIPSLRQASMLIALVAFFAPILGLKPIRLFIFCAVALFAFAYPRFDYFHLIPSLSLFAISLSFDLKSFKKLNPILAIISLSALSFLTLFTIRYYLNNWNREIRFFEADVYAEAATIKSYIGLSKSIYVQNGPDQLFPIAGFLPINPWADEFPWYLEFNDLQDEIVQSLKENQPKFIIYKPYEHGEEFQIGSYKPSKVTDYIDKNYENYTKVSDTLWLKILK